MALSKRKRFEVFKRDSFTCQYCGKKAPDVVLECDHIEPRSKGGADDMINLTTACKECNRGKGAVALDDDSAVQRQRRQLEDLQERQEQIQMMLDWHRSLVDLDTQSVDSAETFWCDLADWTGITDEGRNDLRKIIRKHGLEDVLTAMREATHYFKYDDDGNITSESTNHAFNKLGAICRIKVAEQSKPYLKDLFYTRGIVRNRMYCKDHVAKEILEQSYAVGIPTEVSRDVARRARNWSQWQDEMHELIGSWGEEGDDGE